MAARAGMRGLLRSVRCRPSVLRPAVVVRCGLWRWCRRVHGEGRGDERMCLAS